MNQDEHIAALQTELLRLRGHAYAANALLRLLLKQSKPDLYSDLHKEDVRTRLRFEMVTAAFRSSDPPDSKLDIGTGVDEFFNLLTVSIPPR